jgi:hypothetical protein
VSPPPRALDGDAQPMDNDIREEPRGTLSKNSRDFVACLGAQEVPVCESTRVSEIGPRIYKELTPMKKEHLDLEKWTVWIPGSKTPNGVAEVPLTEIAIAALQSQLAVS